MRGNCTAREQREEVRVFELPTSFEFARSTKNGSDVAPLSLGVRGVTVFARC